MSREIYWTIQNGTMAKNKVLPRTTLFFKNLIQLEEFLINT